MSQTQLVVPLACFWSSASLSHQRPAWWCSPVISALRVYSWDKLGDCQVPDQPEISRETLLKTDKWEKLVGADAYLPETVAWTSALRVSVLYSGW